MAAIESRLEGNFTAWCRERKIIAVKGPVMNTKGFPDRFLQLPNQGGTIYVEFKGTGYYSLTPIQQWWRDYIKASSPNRYFLVETPEQLEQLKKVCLVLMKIGPEVTQLESSLMQEALGVL